MAWMPFSSFFLEASWGAILGVACTSCRARPKLLREIRKSNKRTSRKVLSKSLGGSSALQHSCLSCVGKHRVLVAILPSRFHEDLGPLGLEIFWKLSHALSVN